MNNEFRRICKEVVMAFFMVLLQLLPRGTEEKDANEVLVVCFRHILNPAPT